MRVVGLCLGGMGEMIEIVGQSYIVDVEYLIYKFGWIVWSYLKLFL